MASCTRLYDQLDKISNLLCDFTELSKTYLKKNSKKLIDLQNKWSKNILKMENLVKHLKILGYDYAIPQEIIDFKFEDLLSSSYASSSSSTSRIFDNQKKKNKNISNSNNNNPFTTNTSSQITTTTDTTITNNNTWKEAKTNYVVVLDSDDEKPQEVNKCDGSVVDVIMIGTESNPLIINDSCEELCGELIEKEEEIFLENIKNTLEIYDNEFDYRIKNGFPLNSKKLKEKYVSDDSAMESGVEIDTSKLEPIDKLRNLQCIDFHQGSGDVNEMAFHISKFKNHEGPKLAIAYIANHDPKYNMTGNLQLFDARKGTVYYLQGHYDHHTETTNEKLWKSVTDVKFSQRGKFIYSCSTDKKVIIWSSIGKEDQICTPLATVECEDTVNRIAVKHDKSKVTYQFASCDNSGSITCFSLNADEGNSYKLDKNILQMKTKITTAPPIVDIVYGVDYFDQTIVAGFEGVESQKDGFIRLWDIETKRKLTDYKIGSNNSVSCLGMSASGYRVACGVTSTSDQVRSDGNIRLIELASSEKKMFQTNEYDSNVIAFSPDDQYIALGGVGNKVWIFDTRYENKPLRMLSHITPNDGLIYEGINGIQWINSNMILTGGSDGIVKLWNINKSENSSTCLKYEFPEHDSPITCIRADEDLNYLSVGVSTGRVYLYSTDQTVLNNRDNIRFYYHNE
ncbi:19591_t:CDS:2 [Entrophospora sp. SA101]|nr:19588_t:CDS:2 [Entrophospora sp. SA101]CAJ0836636.1 19591_t:CDS:2 [Entrophospora sp. SA101]